MQKASGSDSKKILDRIEHNNQEIEKAAKIAAMLKSEGWGLFWEDLQGYDELLSRATLAELAGSVLDKGAAVERIQGKLEVMNAINADVEYYLKKATEPIVDVAEARKQFSALSGDNAEESNAT